MIFIYKYLTDSSNFSRLFLKKVMWTLSTPALLFDFSFFLVPNPTWIRLEPPSDKAENVLGFYTDVRIYMWMVFPHTLKYFHILVLGWLSESCHGFSCFIEDKTIPSWWSDCPKLLFRCIGWAGIGNSYSLASDSVFICQIRLENIVFGISQPCENCLEVI